MLGHLPSKCYNCHSNSRPRLIRKTRCCRNGWPVPPPWHVVGPRPGPARRALWSVRGVLSDRCALYLVHVFPRPELCDFRPHPSEGSSDKLYLTLSETFSIRTHSPSRREFWGTVIGSTSVYTAPRWERRVCAGAGLGHLEPERPSTRSW